MAKHAFQIAASGVAIVFFLFWLFGPDQKKAANPTVIAQTTVSSAQAGTDAPVHMETSVNEDRKIYTTSEAWRQWREPLSKLPGEWTATQAWAFWDEAVARTTKQTVNALHDRGEKEARLIAVALRIESGLWDTETGDRMASEGDLDLLAEATDRLFISNRFSEWNTLVDAVLDRTTPAQFADWRSAYLENPHGAHLPPLLALLDFGRGRDFFLVEIMRREPAFLDVWLGDIASQSLIQAGRLRTLAAKIEMPSIPPEVSPDENKEIHDALWMDWLERVDRRKPAGLPRTSYEKLIRQFQTGTGMDYPLRQRRALLAYHAGDIR